VKTPDRLVRVSRGHAQRREIEWIAGRFERLFKRGATCAAAFEIDLRIGVESRTCQRIEDFDFVEFHAEALGRCANRVSAAKKSYLRATVRRDACSGLDDAVVFALG